MKNKLNKLFLKIHNYLLKISTAKFIIVMFIWSFVILIPPIPILMHYVKSSAALGGPSIASSSLIIKLLVGCIVVPICETFLFQWLPIKVLRYFIKDKDYIIILISAVLFGIDHYYSIWYSIEAFLVGIVLAYAFVMCERRKDSPIAVVAIIHGLKNLVATVFL